MTTKREVLQEHLKGWLSARGDRKRRGELTKLVSQALHIHPKSVSRSFRREQMRDPFARGDGRGRKTLYGRDVTAALMDIWEAGDRPCGELLYPMVAEYVTILRRDEEWNHPPETTDKLLTMSERTMKRRVLGLAKKHGGRGYSTTRGGILKPTIPIFKGPWKDLPPGNGQVDTVAHCGGSIAGDYVFTVNYTDAATYWVVPRAQWNKGQVATKESLSVIRRFLPFSMLMLHPDTGSEFINWNLKAWCDKEGIRFTRSEPGRKNDNMYVEERNGHVVRRYLGYVRYDTQGVENALNAFYEVLSVYLNHFKAVRRCVLKERVGAKYVRRYERTAKTPYQRVLEHTAVSEEVKRHLQEEHGTLNPLHLKRQMGILLQKAYKQQTAARTDSVA